MANGKPTNPKNFIDLTREIGQVRNSKLAGSNWLAQALQKIHDAIRAMQQNTGGS